MQRTGHLCWKYMREIPSLYGRSEFECGIRLPHKQECATLILVEWVPILQWRNYSPKNIVKYSSEDICSRMSHFFLEMPGACVSRESLHLRSTSYIQCKALLATDGIVRSQHLNCRFGLECPENEDYTIS